MWSFSACLKSRRTQFDSERVHHYVATLTVLVICRLPFKQDFAGSIPVVATNLCPYGETGYRTRLRTVSLPFKSAWGYQQQSVTDDFHE